MFASTETAVTVVPSIVIVPDTSGVRPTAVVEPIPLNSSWTRKPTNVPVESSKLNSPIDVSTVHVPAMPVVVATAPWCRLRSSSDRPRRRSCPVRGGHGGLRLGARHGVLGDRRGGGVEVDRGRSVVLEEPPDAEPGEHRQHHDATGDPLAPTDDAGPWERRGGSTGMSMTGGPDDVSGVTVSRRSAQRQPREPYRSRWRTRC